MIVPLLTQAQAVLGTYTQFQQDRDQSNRYSETLIALRAVHSSVAAFAESYHHVAPRIRDYLPLVYNARISAVRNKLRESRVRFASTPWQVAALKTIQNEITSLNSDLLAAWKTYATNQVKPKLELYDLLKELPEVQRNQATFTQILAELTRQAGVVPRNSRELMQFDSRLDRITTTLTEVQGITPVIQDFLRRSHLGTFTVADLNDEILSWCRVNDRGRSFNIRP